MSSILLAVCGAAIVGSLRTELLTTEIPSGTQVQILGEVAKDRFVLVLTPPKQPNQPRLFLDGRSWEIPPLKDFEPERFLGMRQGVIVSRAKAKDYSYISTFTRRATPPFDLLGSGITDRFAKAAGVEGEVMTWMAAPGDQLYAGANEGRLFFLYDSKHYSYSIFHVEDVQNPNPGYAVVSLGSKFFASTHVSKRTNRLGITVWDEAINATHLFAPRGYDGLVVEAVSRTGDVAGRALAKGKNDLYVKRRGQKPVVFPAPKWAVGGRLVAQEFLSDGTLVGTLERDNEKSTEMWVVRGRTLTRLVGNTTPLKITWAQYVGLGYDEKSFLVRVGLGGSKWGWARIRP